MERFEYQILVGQYELTVPARVTWLRDGDPEAQLGGDLRAILNDLGGQGWEVAGIGNLGFTEHNEILLKRRLPPAGAQPR